MGHDNMASASAAASNFDGENWKHPSRNLQIRMAASPGAALAAKALQGLKKKEPREVGGVLFGTLRSDATEPVLTIVDVEFIAAENKLFNSGPDDLRALASAVERPRADGLVPVGFFRSHIREGLSLSAQDRKLADEYFPADNGLWLLVRPFQMGVCMAGFFVRENGTLQGEFTDFEVPLFDSAASVALAEIPDVPPKAAAAAAYGGSYELRNSEPRSSGLRRPDTVPVSNSMQGSGIERVNEQPVRSTNLAPAVQRDRQSPSTVAIWCLSAALIGLAAAVVISAFFLWSGLYGKRSRPETAEVQALVSTQSSVRAPVAKGDVGLGLQVARPAANQFDLSWNRNLPQSVLGGQVEVEDGRNHQRIALNGDQLRSGKLTYFSNSGDVGFRLDMNLGINRALSESIRVLAPGMARAPVRVVHSDASSDSEAAKIGNSGKPFQTVNSPRPVQSSARTYIGKDAPVVGGALPTMQENQIIGEVVGPSPKESFEALQNAPAAYVGYIAPQPLKQVMPDIRTLLPTEETEPVRVQVSVKVDNGGNVVSASTAKKSIWTGTCVKAAMKWHFTPAMLHGEPVASTYVITFRFRPQH